MKMTNPISLMRMLIVLLVSLSMSSLYAQCAFQLENFTITEKTATSLSVEWEVDASPSSWEVQLIPAYSTPEESGGAISSATYIANDLEEGVFYDFYIKGICLSSESDWVGPIRMQTAADFCNEGYFYDNGGGIGAYYSYTDNDMETVLTPANDGEQIRLVFNSFDIGVSENGPQGRLRYYNSTVGSSGYQFLGVSSGTNTPNTIYSTATDGALTMIYEPLAGYSVLGWEAMVICEPQPEYVTTPSDIIVSEILETSVTIDWEENGSAELWEVEVVAANGVPTLSGEITGSKPYTINNLTEGNYYDVYVRSVYGDGVTNWSDRYRIYTTHDYCGGDYFYDNGGAEGYYGNLVNETQVISPTNSGDKVSVTFESFEVEEGKDFLHIYNGTVEDEAQLLASLTGMEAYTITSTDETGALTFVFESDYTGQAAGWEAVITCAEAADCAQVPGVPIVGEVGMDYVEVSWSTAAGVDFWEVAIVESGEEIEGQEVSVSENTYVAMNLASNTDYEVYVRSVCGDIYTNWTLPSTFTTLPDYCGGDRFYDAGGVFGNVLGDEEHIIYPQEDGGRVGIVIHYLDIGTNSSLKVKNGDLFYSPVLETYYGASNSWIGDTLYSTDLETGALSLMYDINDSSIDQHIFGEGWDIEILCEPIPPCLLRPTNMELVERDETSLLIDWEDNVEAEEWEVRLTHPDLYPDGYIVTATEHPFLIDGLEKGVYYGVSVRAVCGEEPSDWSNEELIHTIADYCGGNHFYDLGGPYANYDENDELIRTIVPHEEGDRVVASVNKLSIGNDKLYVYNGTTINAAQLLYVCTEEDAPPRFYSTHESGALTFKLDIDGGVNSEEGWDISIDCESKASCSQSPVAVSGDELTVSSVRLEWIELGTGDEWEIEVINLENPSGWLVEEVSTNPYTLDALESDTDYVVKVRSLCDEGYSEWSDPFLFSTHSSYCEGDHFYDTGGASDNHGINEVYYKTIMPSEAGERIRAIFKSYNISTDSYLHVYDGVNLQYPKIATGTQWNKLKQVMSSDASGALTFEFISSDYSPTVGWDALILCEPFPTCDLPGPNNLEVVEVNYYDATLSWGEENEDIGSWEIEVINLSTEEITLLDSDDNNLWLLTNLEEGTRYSVAVRGVCENGVTEWSHIAYIQTKVDYCLGKHFYDSGGPLADYNSEDQIITFFANSSDSKVKLDFIDFSTNLDEDVLIVYNGVQDTGVPIFEHSGGVIPQHSIVSTDTSGALTVKFHNSYYYNRDRGWDIWVDCVNNVECNIEATSVEVSEETTNSLLFTWEGDLDTSVEWEVELVAYGEKPLYSGEVISGNNHLYTSLERGDYYDFYIRSVCGEQLGVWKGPFRGRTTPDYCSGEHFYDNGGPDFHHSRNNEIKTIYPEEDGMSVRLSFYDFSLAYGSRLKIYNGPSTESPLLVELSGDYTSEPTMLSTHVPTGALTVEFVASTSGYTASGWDAIVDCVPMDNCPNEPIIEVEEVLPSSITIALDEYNGATSWELELVQEGAEPTGSGVVVTTPTYTWDGIDPQTNYYIYARSLCGEGQSEWTQSEIITTLIDY